MIPDIDTAQEGAPAAPVEDQATPDVQTDQIQAPAPDTEVETPEKAEKGRLQHRLNELTKARREAERERDFYRQQAEQFQRQQPPQQQPHNEMPTPEEYGHDLHQWGGAVAERAVQIAEQRVQQQLQQRQQEQMYGEFEAREQAYAKDNPGYLERVEQLTSVVTFNPALGEILATSDHGPALVDYLAKNLHEADQLARLPPHIAAVQIGRIEARIATPKQTPISSAPTPHPALKGGSQPAVKDPSKMSDDEWYAYNRRGK